jgi:hypothetical protein
MVVMTFTRDHIAFFIGFVILGGILGIAVGSFMVKLAPSLSILTAPLTKPIGFDGELISVYVRLNIAAVAGLIAGIVLFRWI